MLLVLQFMKFLRQGDLFSVVREETGKMKEEHLVQNILYPFLSSLQYLHSKARHLGLGTFILCISFQGIIHRDIKPENIFVTQDHSIKIAGFANA